MKIKRYFASDIRQAIRMVREEQGPDAVILSNRRVDGGVEIVAALDYDEAAVRRMASGQELGRNAYTPKEIPPSMQPARVAASLAGAAPPANPPGEFSSKASFVASREAPPAVDKLDFDFPSPFDPVAEPVASSSGRQRPSSPNPEIVWSQDPSLVAMREEMQMLRSLLENQLSGLAWREMKQQHPHRIKILEKLMQMGLSSTLCREIADQIQYGNDMPNNWRQALGLLAARVSVTNDDILNHGGSVALIGPCGVGKTTTVAKLAARFTLRHGPGKVALVTTDNFRIGAHQQLRTYGQILGAPVHVAKDGEDLQAILNSLRDKQLVLIDTAGMGQRDVRLSEQFAVLKHAGHALRTYVVLSASSQRAALDEVLRVFDKVQLDGAILTKLDEAAVLGEAISALVQQQLAVAYVSDGQAVPEDLHPARSNSLVNRCVTLMQRYSEAPTEEQLAMRFGRMAG
ncbi:MAG: flagellar biosynthesis protein FlhF [Thiohalomonadaceae bacterium]